MYNPLPLLVEEWQAQDELWLANEFLVVGYTPMMKCHARAREILQAVTPNARSDVAALAAQQAIVECENCLEAYIMLGEHEPNPSKAVEIFRRGIEAAAWMKEVQISDRCQENILLIAYLFFRTQIADQLWSIGQRVEAIEHLMEIVEYDDEGWLSLGLRLLFHLLDMGWDRELEECLEKGVSTGTYCGEFLIDAMRFYRDPNHQEEARSSLEEIANFNPILLHLMLDASHYERRPTGGDSLEDLEEAHTIARLALPVARSLPGFMKWMRETAPIDRIPEPDPKLSPSALKASLIELPQCDETWVIDYRKIQGFWMFIAYCHELGEAIRIESMDEKLSVAELWELVADSMLDPRGQARRPTRLLVMKKGLLQNWKKRCQDVGLELAFGEEDLVPLDFFDQFKEIIHRVDHDIPVDPQTLDQLLSLPLSQERWIVGMFQPPIWITDGITPTRPWVALVLDRETGVIMMQEMAPNGDEELPVRAVIKAMLNNLLPDSPAHLPESIGIHHRTSQEPLNDYFGELQTSIGPADAEEEKLIETCVECLIRQISAREGREALLDTEGVTTDELASLYQAAARFWKVAPWRQVAGDRPIEIQSPFFRNQPWYAVIVGQLGMNLGLVLYDQRDALERVLDSDGEVDPDGVFLNYLEKFEIPSIDLWYQEKFGWTIASEEAYPLIERALPKHRHRRPNRSELLAMDVVLRSLPAFINSPESETPFSLPVQSFDKKIDVSLRWLH